MQIGSFGSLAFEVSSSSIKTIQSLALKGSATYAKHSRAGNKEITEFTGVETVSGSFDMIISSYLGVDPKTEINRIRRMTEEGYIGRLVVGDDYIGRFVIQSYSVKASEFDRKTGITSCSVSVSILEYVEV